LSGKRLSNELRKLKDKYHSLSHDFEKSIFINEAEGIMEQLEEILTETKSNFEELSHFNEHKVNLASPLYIIITTYSSTHIFLIN